MNLLKIFLVKIKKELVASNMLLLCVLVCGCAPTMTSSGKIKNIVESYYKGPGNTMYFIKPILFEGIQSEISTDFTLQISDSVNLVKGHVSIFSAERFILIDSILYGNQHKILTCVANPVLMFKEIKGGKKIARYELTLTLAEFKEWSTSALANVHVYANDSLLKYTIKERKWTKIKQRITDVIFIE
jgi:hypothetical protein